MIALERGPFGTYLVRNLDAGELPPDDPRASLLVQTGWDYPATAAAFGWSIAAWANYRGDNRRVSRAARLCAHEGTDGTIACPDCGTPATAFICAAAEWMDDHIGATAEDPGWFDAS